MPNKVCPRCHRQGFVRVEHVIRGGWAVRSFVCGACGHAWTETEAQTTTTSRDEGPNH